MAIAIRKAWPGHVCFDIYQEPDGVIALLDFGSEREAPGDAEDLADAMAEAVGRRRARRSDL